MKAVTTAHPRRRSAKTAIEPDAVKAAVRDPLAERRAHRPCPPPDPDAGLGRRSKPLVLNAAYTAKIAELAPVLEGKPDVTKIDRDRSGAAGARVSHAAHRLRDGTRCLRPDAARLAGQQGSAAGAAGASWWSSSSVPTKSSFTRRCSTRTTCARRLILTLNMTKVVQHIREAIRFDNRAAGAGLRPRPPDPLHR